MSQSMNSDKMHLGRVAGHADGAGRHGGEVRFTGTCGPREKSSTKVPNIAESLSRHHFPFSSLCLHLGSSLPRSSAERVLKKS